MTPSQLAVEIESADDADVREAVRVALVEAGISLDELIDEAKMGRFSSEDARMAWWVISPFLDAAA